MLDAERADGRRAPVIAVESQRPIVKAPSVTPWSDLPLLVADSHPGTKVDAPGDRNLKPGQQLAHDNSRSDPTAGTAGGPA